MAIAIQNWSESDAVVNGTILLLYGAAILALLITYPGPKAKIVLTLTQAFIHTRATVESKLYQGAR